MKSVNDIQPQNPEQGFQFPGVFEITVVGKAEAGLETRVIEVLTTLGLHVLGNSLNVRASRAGNYIALTLSFTCPTREQYDAAHEALRADAAVRWTL